MVEGDGLPFADRAEAGKRLADALAGYTGRHDVLVLALPRGGVPVAWEVARRLDAELDVLLVRKLGVPGNEELAMGAIATGGHRVLNQAVIEQLSLPESAVARMEQRERQVLERREKAFRGDRPVPAVEGRTVILVDDGAATGATMRAAILALRQQGPARIVAAVPFASREAVALFDGADEVVCLATPSPFVAVGNGYRAFPQLSDAAVRDILQQARERPLYGESGPPRT